MSELSLPICCELLLLRRTPGLSLPPPPSADRSPRAPPAPRGSPWYVGRRRVGDPRHLVLGVALLRHEELHADLRAERAQRARGQPAHHEVRRPRPRVLLDAAEPRRLQAREPARARCPLRCDFKQGAPETRAANRGARRASPPAGRPRARARVGQRAERRVAFGAASSQPRPTPRTAVSSRSRSSSPPSSRRRRRARLGAAATARRPRATPAREEDPRRRARAAGRTHETRASATLDESSAFVHRAPRHDVRHDVLGMEHARARDSTRARRERRRANPRTPRRRRRLATMPMRQSIRGAEIASRRNGAASAARNSPGAR